MATLPDYRLNVEQPFLAAARGFQLGVTTETALQDRALKQQAAQLEAQNLQAAQQRQQQFQSGISSFFAKPPEERKYDELATLMVGADKQQFEALKQIGDNMTAEKKDASQRFTAQTLLALEANPDVALASLEQRINAETDPGQKQALGVIRDIAKVDAKQAGVLLEELGAATFGKTWYDGITAARGERRAAALAPSALAEQEAKAKEAAVKAKFAESVVVKDLDLKDAQIQNYATQQDIARQNQRIAAMQAQAAQEGNVLKRQELQLKIDAAQEARDQSVRDKYSQAQNVLATFDNTLISVDKILNNWGKTKDGKIDPNLSNSTVKSATGPVQSRMFTTSQDVADFEEQVASLESQAFLSQVEKMRGLGALTEREGARLVNALASLSLRQSPKQLAENLLVVKDLMQKARSSAEAKYGALQSQPTAPAGTGNSVRVGNQTFNRPPNFTDDQWSAYKQSVGAR